jgi:hypothetical protein
MSYLEGWMQTRRRIASLLIAALPPMLAPMIGADAGEPRPTVTGNWDGSYVCAQGVTGLTLTIARQSGATFSGTFHFYPPPGNTVAKEGCFAVTGHFVTGRRVFIGGSAWISRPAGYINVDLDGQIDAAAKTITGKVKVPAQYGPLCSTFRLTLLAGPAVTPAPCQTTKSASLGPL